MVYISALKGEPVSGKPQTRLCGLPKTNAGAPVHGFLKRVEEALDEIESLLDGNIPEEQRRFYAVKLFERDDKIGETISGLPDVETIVASVEKDLDDDSREHYHQ